MSISTARILTEQFYAWERNCRGWTVADEPCELEPPFVPFFSHFIPESPIIDDAKVVPWWESLALIPPQPLLPTMPKIAMPTSYPFEGTSGLITVYAVTLPGRFKQSRERLEHLLAVLSYRKSCNSFEIIAADGEITLQWTVRNEDRAFFFSQINMFFPECSVIETCDDNVLEVLENAHCIYVADFGLEEESMRPLACGGNLEYDPYTPLFGILEHIDTDEAVIIQILFSGTYNAWGESMIRAACDNDLKTSFFVDAPEMPQLAKEKTRTPLCAVTVRAVTTSDTLEDAQRLVQHVALAIIHASTSSTNKLMLLDGETYTIQKRLVDVVMRETHRVGMLLNISELTTFVHFPSSSIASKKLLKSIQATRALPDSLIGHLYELGHNVHQGVETTASITIDQRLRHIHIMGATGTGKSTLLKSLMMQDVNNGTGFMCLDPHGDLIEDILLCMPQERIKDVILIDPSDSEFPIGLNILVAHSDIEKELLASDLVALFRRFSTSWGDQMNSVFANAILAFVFNTKQYHLGDLRKFLIETSYRNVILATSTDPDIVYYWQKEFPIVKSASIGPILTRLDSFLRPKVIRNMVCQTKSIDFAHLMDTNKIVLVKLSQGLLGAENSFLLGAFIVSKLQQIAMARQAQKASTRVPFFCYIDEFQHFITPSMATILSGTRKYGLGLILSHQDMQQVTKFDAEIASSVLANAGTRICFRLGDTDAKRLEDGFNGFTHEDLQNLRTGEAIARVNTTSNDFNLEVIVYDGENDEENKEAIIEHTRNVYSVPIPIVSVPTEQSSFTKDPNTEPVIEPVVKSPINTILVEESPKQDTVREHRYIQTFIKGMAEAEGYKASLEVKTPDGKGQVDVLLERDGQSIAVEISVTTTAEWELHNIEKCLAAEYDKVVVCSSNPMKLQQIKQLVQKNIEHGQQQRIFFVTPETFQGVLAPQSIAQPPATVMKGYRVKVQYEEGGVSKQELLKSIIKASQKP